MSIKGLEALFEPQAIAVIGAGAEEDQVGHIVLRNLVDGDFPGVVYPVNPHREAISGVRAYASVADLPTAVDLAVICTPGAAVPGIVRECGEQGVRALAVLSAGFREAGGEGKELEAQLRSELRQFPAMRLLGPNCLGLIVPRRSLNASFGGVMPAAGQLAFVSQSGALATAIIDWARSEGIGFSHVVTLGNMLDVDVADVIDYLGEDQATRGLILYVESVTNSRRFMSAARAFARNRPIIVYKAGRFAASAQAAFSHTGALAGADDVYEAAFRRAGLVRVGRIEEVFSTAGLLAREHPARNGRLAIVTNAGGPAVMAADTLLSRGGTLAKLSEDVLARLDAALPAPWSHGNPIDVLGDATPERYATAVAAALGDAGVDGVLVILTPQAMSDPDGSASALLEAANHHAFARKPLLAAWMGGATVERAAALLARGGVATYAYPEQAIDAFMDLVAYARNLALLHETPRAVPAALHLDRSRAELVLAQGLAEAPNAGALSAHATKQLLDAYGIEVSQSIRAEGAQSAIAAAEEVGLPVVMKIDSPQITHKSDVGGVVSGLTAPAQVAGAYEQMVARMHELRPEATLRGVTVEPMVGDVLAELLLGARQDATFGAVVLVGAGGTAAELLGDRVLELPPLNERLARAMLESLRIWPLLRGYRGRPGAAIDRLVEVMIRFSYLVADHPEVLEVEVNPLAVRKDDVLALDARALVDPERARDRPAPFSHLAIRPYPEEHTREAITRSGLRVRLRAIMPEDEPRWHEMLDSCSPRSIFRRFRAPFKHTHEAASRFCFIDYDRELAIVAELLEGPDQGKLAGVGRLVADPDRGRAEYALLIADPWQGQGLGDLITERCLEIGRSWGLQSIYAETGAENQGMIAVMRSHGFTLARHPADGMVVGELKL